MTENSDQNSDEDANAAFYEAARLGHLEEYKQLMIDFGLKNPTVQIIVDESVTALDIAINYHHSALSRVISKVSKEIADLNWKVISNQSETLVEDDAQKMAYLNNVESMKKCIKEHIKGKFKNLKVTMQ